MNTKEQTFNIINHYNYEQYNSVWCKTINSQKLKPNKNDDTVQALILESIETICMNYTSESFTYNFQWREDNWTISTENEHIDIIDEMIKYCFIFREQERQEAIQERNIWLSYFDVNGMKEYEKAPEELKERINLEQHYQQSFINENEEAKPVFVKHKELKDNFLNNLFSENVQFYCNHNLEKTKKSLIEKDRKNVPAIIGIDNERVGLFWFNF